MANRLAGELALLAAAAVLLQSAIDGESVQAAIEHALWGGLGGWAAGWFGGEVVRRLALESAHRQDPAERDSPATTAGEKT